MSRSSSSGQISAATGGTTAAVNSTSACKRVQRTSSLRMALQSSRGGGAFSLYALAAARTQSIQICVSAGQVLWQRQSVLREPIFCRCCGAGADDGTVAEGAAGGAGDVPAEDLRAP